MRATSRPGETDLGDGVTAGRHHLEETATEGIENRLKNNPESRTVVEIRNRRPGPLQHVILGLQKVARAEKGAGQQKNWHFGPSRSAAAGPGRSFASTWRHAVLACAEWTRPCS
jgi:hypothetical protein